MDHALRISPTLALGADTSPGGLTVSRVEAWGSFAAIAGMVIATFSGLGTAVWLLAISV